jgi:hypothetical protein
MQITIDHVYRQASEIDIIVEESEANEILKLYYQYMEDLKYSEDYQYWDEIMDMAIDKIISQR